VPQPLFDLKKNYDSNEEGKSQHGDNEFFKRLHFGSLHLRAVMSKNEIRHR
jgi:hypothetical protein